MAEETPEAPESASERHSRRLLGGQDQGVERARLPPPPPPRGPFAPSRISPLRRDFRRDGHVLVRDLVQGVELSGATRVLADMVLRDVGQRARREVASNPGHLMIPNTDDAISKHLDTLRERPHVKSTNNWLKSTAVEKLARHPLLTRMAAELLGVETVRLYQDTAFWKLPGYDSGPWHRDMHHVPLDTPIITAWLPLVSISPEMGCLEFASGSHKEEKRDMPIHVNEHLVDHEDGSSELETPGLVESHYKLWRCGSDGGDGLEGEISSESVKENEKFRLKPGDVTFHHGWLLHRSMAHHGRQGQGPREALSIRYIAAHAEIVHPQTAPDARVISEHDKEANHWWIRGRGD